MHKSEKSQRYILAGVLLLMTVSASGGGSYGMTGANGIPVQWLNGSPFHSYFIPGLVLFFGVGGSCLAAAIAVFKGHFMARNVAINSCIIMLVWLFLQTTIIGYVSWLQPTTAVVGMIILFMSLNMQPVQLYKQY